MSKKSHLEIGHTNGYRPLFLGGGLFLLFTPIHLIVAQNVSVLISALTLAIIAGAYIGFAAQAHSPMVFLGELVVAIGFALIALVGVLWHSAVIAVGLILHAAWDFLHHNTDFGANVPEWYIPFCVFVDIAAGAFLLVLYLW